MISRIRKRFEQATLWLDPEANPSGIVYGVLTVGALVAAESTRRETYAALIEASTLALVLYWLAHGYARYFSSRLEEPGIPGLRWIARDLLHEAAMLKGAVLPIVALMVSWACSATLSSGVTAGLWTAGIELLVLELVAGLRRRLAPLEVAAEIALGLCLGGGLLAVRAVLH